MTPLNHCPACGREFKHILDYPRVRILDFERLPIPEAVDSFSAAAAEKRLRRLRAGRSDAEAVSGDRQRGPLRQDGINMTPQIAQACQTCEVQDYLARLAALRGREVAPQDLLPPLAAHGQFKWAHPVAGTGIYLSLSDCDAPAEDVAGQPKCRCIATARTWARRAARPCSRSGQSHVALPRGCSQPGERNGLGSLSAPLPPAGTLISANFH